MGPDRAAVVGEPARTGGESAASVRRPNPESRSRRREHATRPGRASPGSSRPVPSRWPDVAGDRVDRPAVAVEGDREVALGRRADPERAREPGAQVGGPLDQRRRTGSRRTRRAGPRRGSPPRRRTPAPRTVRSAPRPAVRRRTAPSRRLSFQPWLARPVPVWSTYRSQPSPADCASCHARQPRTARQQRAHLVASAPQRAGVGEQCARTAGWRRRCRSRAAAASGRGRGSRAAHLVQDLAGLLLGGRVVARSPAGGRARAGSRARASVPSGSSIRAAQSESRPNSVRYHGRRPRGTVAVVGEREALEVGEALLGGTPEPDVGCLDGDRPHRGPAARELRLGAVRAP